MIRGDGDFREIGHGLSDLIRIAFDSVDSYRPNKETHETPHLLKRYRILSLSLSLSLSLPSSAIRS